MDKDQANKIIKDTFERPFDKGRFTHFIKNLLNCIDEDTFINTGNYIPDSFKQDISLLERIGKYIDGENQVDILIVKLKNTASIYRARTMQRNFVARYLNGSRGGKLRDAALVAFVSPNEADWRFSLVKMDYRFEETKGGKIKAREQFTPARRWSFLVGVNEKSHTAKIQFWEMLADDTHAPTLGELEKAFNIEKVTKEFFEKYRDLFLWTKEILDDVASNNSKIKADFAAKGVNTIDFAKKLLGQIVFLYFLQKKGWFGVERGAVWGTGSKHFLRELFDCKHGKYSNFFNDILEPLFYDALRIDHSHDGHYSSRFNCKIPFLNGGLFDPINDYDWVQTDIFLPNELFSNNAKTKEGDTGNGILDIFDRYNFTVKEDEPLEKEVAVDPEMLGKVFENLLEVRDRKSKGTYYTPREIVHYMCQQSLVNYLATVLHGKISKEDFEVLIRCGEQVGENEAAVIAKGKETDRYFFKLSENIRQYAGEIDEMLADIKVCDPAIGSGAFLVGMMSEIVKTRNVLSSYLERHGRTFYNFKRECIEKALYGVDIDPGAVEIAKLRLWLSLVVDEDDIKQIKPLPNLDYKIVCGNSLLGLEKQTTLFHIDELENLKNLFLNEINPTKKQNYKHQINDLMTRLLDKAKDFNFCIYFSEVFHNRRGFDVVIANPPYVSVEKFARTALQTEWKRRFKTYASRGDIYCFFYEQGLALLREGGVLTFISSNKFQRAGYGKGLRQLLAAQWIHILIDFCELPVFAAATDPMIVIVTKVPVAADHEFPVLVVKDETEFSSLSQSIESRASRYKPKQLKTEGWSLEGGDGLALVDKLRAKGTPLGIYVNDRFYYGIKTGLNEAFVIDRATRNHLISEDRKSAKLIMPWIRGKDIKRWTHEFHDLYVIIVRFDFHTELKNYPAILRHLTRFEKQLKARGQCKTSRSGAGRGQHHWLELDNNPSESYIATFAEPKIVFNETSKRLHAYLDLEGNAINKTGSIILSPDSQFVLTVLNSTPMDWLFRSTFPSWGDPWNSGRIQFRGNLMNQIPIPPASVSDKACLTRLAEQAAESAAAGDEVAVGKIEREIDKIICDLFDLTPAEEAYIEGALANIC